MPSDVSKPVKKEEADDDGKDREIIGSVLGNGKKKPSNAATKSPPSKETKVKKENTVAKKEELADDSEEPSAKTSSNKTDKVQKKKKKEEEDKTKKKKKGAIDAHHNGKKREKKVYDLPGQKRDAPEERDPMRIFYETLYKQVPTSEMAAFWMMESGLLPITEAKKVFEMKQRKNQQQKLSSPMKTVVTVKKKAEFVTIKSRASSTPVSKKTPDSKVASTQSKKRTIKSEVSDSGSDDDFVLAERKTKKQRVG